MDNFQLLHQEGNPLQTFFFSQHRTPVPPTKTPSTFTIVEIQTPLPDFILGMTPYWIFSAWQIWAEIFRYLRDNISISSLSIDR